jgi:hypothetical protein
MAPKDEVALSDVQPSVGSGGSTVAPPRLRLGARVPSLPVPRRASRLSPEWLTKALRFSKLLEADVAVVSVSTRAIGDGVMGDISSVEVTYSAPTAAPAKLVAKFSPVGKAPLPGFVVRAVFKAEAHFYNDFSVKESGLTRPACYLALYDPTRLWRASFCMLLEDLMPATTYSRVVGNVCTERGPLLAFAAGIARLHARWWEHPKARPLGWALHPSRDLGGLVLRGFMQMAKTGLPALAECYPAAFAPIASWLPLLRRRHRWIVRECLRPPVTLTHGDAHIENAFFDARFADGVSFIDFGNVMFSPGTSDVAFFMVHSLGADTRKAHEEAVVKAYHDALLAHGVTGYDYERCWHDYRFNMWRALLSLCAMGPGLNKQRRRKVGPFAEAPTAEEAKERRTYEELVGRAVTAMVEHKWLDLLLEESEQSCGLCSGLSVCY